MWDVYVDVEEEKEEHGDNEGVYLCGGEEGGDEEGGDILYDFKGVLITNFWTCDWISSFVSKSGFENIEKVPSDCLEVEASSCSEVEGNE